MSAGILTTAEDGVNGFILDECDQEWGACNGCGQEVQPHEQCCEDGEVVPAG